MYNSFAYERLIKLIDYKLKRYNELAASNPDSKALRYMDEEIKFLQETILPIVLDNTTVTYREIRDFVTKSMSTIENHPLSKRTNDLLFHFHMRDSGYEQPLALMATNMRHTDILAFDLEINQVSEQILPVYYSKPTFHRVENVE